MSNCFVPVFKTVLNEQPTKWSVTSWPELVSSATSWFQTLRCVIDGRGFCDAALLSVYVQRVHAAPCSWTWSDCSFSETPWCWWPAATNGWDSASAEKHHSFLIRTNQINGNPHTREPAHARTAASAWMNEIMCQQIFEFPDNSLSPEVRMKYLHLTFLRCTNLTFCGTHCRLDASNPQNYTPSQSLTAWCLPFSAAHSRTPVPHFIVLLWVMMNLSDAKLNHAGFLKLKELLRFGLWTEKGHLTAENSAVGRMWHVPMMCNFLDCWIQLKTASLKTSLSIFRDFLVKTQFYTLIMCNHCSPHFSFHPLTCVMCAGLTFLYKTQS